MINICLFFGFARICTSAGSFSTVKRGFIATARIVAKKVQRLHGYSGNNRLQRSKPDLSVLRVVLG